MIRTRQSVTVFSLVAVFACSSATGAEPNDANTPLTFENSSTVLPGPSFRQIRAMESPWKGTVTYAAGVPYNRSLHFPSHGSGEARSFIAYALQHDLTKEQRHFFETTHGELEASHSGGRSGRDYYVLPDFYTPPADPNAPQFLLYAVSLDDAKKMAELYLRYARNRFKDRVVPVQNEIKTLSERLADEQQKLPGAGQAYEAAKKAFEDLQKQVPYRDDKQALDAAAELDKMLNMAQVDIAGIRARIEVIQSYQKKGPSTAVATQLELMFIEEAVALQGAEARRRMATTLRKQADSYIDLNAAWQRAEAEKDRLTHDIFVLPGMIHHAQQKVADEMEQEPKIINNKVFIYPVSQEGQPVLRPQPRS